jgi:hypothetical protein
MVVNENNLGGIRRTISMLIVGKKTSNYFEDMENFYDTSLMEVNGSIY